MVTVLRKAFKFSTTNMRGNCALSNPFKPEIHPIFEYITGQKPYHLRQFYKISQMYSKLTFSYDISYRKFQISGGRT